MFLGIAAPIGEEMALHGLVFRGAFDTLGHKKSAGAATL